MPTMSELEEMERQADGLIAGMAQEETVDDATQTKVPDSTEKVPGQAPEKQEEQLTEELPASDQTEEGDQKPPDKEPENEVSDDSLTVKNAKERISSAQAKMHAAIDSERSALSKVTSLEEEISTLRAQIKILSESRQPEPSPSTQNPASETTQSTLNLSDLEKLKEEVPEVALLADALIASNQRIEALADDNKRLKDSVQEASTKIDKNKVDDARDRHNNTILAKHSDAKSIVVDPEFQGWLMRQSPLTQRAMKDGTANEVIEVFDSYKKAHGIQQQSKGDLSDEVIHKNQSGRGQPSLNQPQFTRSSLQGMSQEEFEKNEAAIDEAIKNGKFRGDL